MARRSKCLPGWQPGTFNEWNSRLLDVLEMFELHTVGDEPDECCFVAVNNRCEDTHVCNSKSWKQSRPELTMENFLEQCGARTSSKDVHWPLTLSMRNKLTPSSERHRSAAGLARRKAYKAARGHGYASAVRPRGRSSGSAARPAPYAAPPAAEPWQPPQRQAHGWTQAEWDAWRGHQWSQAEWGAWRQGR